MNDLIALQMTTKELKQIQEGLKLLKLKNISVKLSNETIEDNIKLYD